MIKTKPHKIQIRNREGTEGITTKGMNTQVLLDGVPLKSCRSFKFEVEAGEMAKVTIEMYAEVEMEIQADLVQSEPENTDLTINGNPVAIYTLSSPFPLTHAQQEALNYKECE